MLFIRLAVIVTCGLFVNGGKIGPVTTKGKVNDSGLSAFVSNYEKLSLHIPMRSSVASVEGNDYDDVMAAQRTGTFHLDILGQHFNVVYTRRLDGIFSPDSRIIVVDGDGRHVLDVADVLSGHIEGHVAGDPDSYVYGDLSAGTFDGVIASSGETYHVELASKYFADDQMDSFNTVAYRMSDVAMCPKVVTHSGLRSCSLENGPLYNNGTEKPEWPVEDMDEDGSDMLDDVRATYGKTCTTKVIVDHTFFDRVAGGSQQTAVHEVALHVETANKIFSGTDFDGDGSQDGIGLQIAEIEMVVTPRGYLLEGEYSDPDKLLKKVAEFDFGDVCAGFVFTYRDLKGVLGAAFEGSADRYVNGGICTRRTRYRKYGPRKMSLNVGLATFAYSVPGKVVPRGRSICTVAHEYGHLFGAPHDNNVDNASCNPSNPEEQYLMATRRAVDARITERNHEFSMCSRFYIWKYVRAKGNCLKK